MKKWSLFLVLLVLSLLTCQARERWTSQQANEWFAKQKYRAGVNYIPAYAINPIEIWSAETFDIKTIEKEFSLMQSIGFNAVRVFLNDLVWNDDPDGANARLEQFLAIADKYDIGVMIVFFTHGGKDGAKLGKQPNPKGTHNSGWVKQPDMATFSDKAKWGRLEKYVKNVISKFANDKRILVWDIYNEPGNIKSEHVVGGKGKLTKEQIKELEKLGIDFIKETAKWARECNPSQPITYGRWTNRLGKEYIEIQYAESDILSYHCYGSVMNNLALINQMKKLNRPIMCTEWMARHLGSNFNPILGFLKNNDIWSFAFGFVAGKMETWRPWPAIDKPSTNGIWFHDIFKANHTPYDPTEIEYIKNVLKK